MANKEKKIISTNLLKIREELGYSQKEFGSILGVTERMICNYETGVNNLTIDKAVFISKKWNYALNWIYCNSATNLPLDSDTLKENPKFIVDIREFFKISGAKITFSIPDNYWKYMLNSNRIENSPSSAQDKARTIAQLNGEYENAAKTDIAWEYSIDKNEFVSMLQFGDSSCIYASDDTPSALHKPSEQMIQEATDFINSLIK